MIKVKKKFVSGIGYQGTYDVENLITKYSAPLDVQVDGMHGLFKTSDLMEYNKAELTLKRGEYFENVNTGLEYLKDYTEKDDFAWDDIQEVKNNMNLICDKDQDNERERELNRCEVNNSKKINLSLIIKT